MKNKFLISLIFVSFLMGANWAVKDSNGNSKLTLEPSGDFNISTGNLQLPEGNFSVMKGNGKIKGNFDVGGNFSLGGDLSIGGSLVVSAPLPHLEINSTTVVEGEDANLSITLYDENESKTTSNNDITIHYKTMNGSAVSSQDYTAVADKTVTLNAGDNSAIITISTTDDSDNEYNRTETAFVKIWIEGDNHKYANSCSSQPGIIGITDNDDGSSSSSGGSSNGNSW